MLLPKENLETLQWIAKDGLREVHEELAKARCNEDDLWRAVRNLTGVVTALSEIVADDLKDRRRQQKQAASGQEGN
jgi:hypothetical protein